MECKKKHRYEVKFKELPFDQGGFGRHKCAGCAYEMGFRDGLIRLEKIHIDLDSLPDSQAGTVRHKSTHAAYSLGYFDGVVQSYKT